jgi:hypothetical protein
VVLLGRPGASRAGRAVRPARPRGGVLPLFFPLFEVLVAMAKLVRATAVRPWMSVPALLLCAGVLVLVIA